MIDSSIFEEVGFTNAETKIYLALLKTGITTAGPLLIETGLQNSTIHKTLHNLVKKGFASFIIKSKTRYYQASNPENLLKFLKEKEIKFKSLLPELKGMQMPIEKQEAEIYEGFKGLKNMLYESIKEAKKGDEWLFFAFNPKSPEDFGNVYTFYKEFDEDRGKKGIITKGIFPSSLKHKAKGRKIETRFVDFPIPFGTTIFNDQVMFSPWENKQVSFLIHSKQLAESFRSFFYSIWNSKK